MESLFEVLLLTRWAHARVYWSTEESIVVHSSDQKFNDEFRRNLRKHGVVLYTKSVLQCTGRSLASQIGVPISAEATTRKEILAAYGKHGLDVDLKRENIEKSKVQVGKLSFDRYGRR
jgi:hypothetical protein